MNIPESLDFTGIKEALTTCIIRASKQRYKDSNLEMTESESVALPFGDSAI